MTAVRNIQIFAVVVFITALFSTRAAVTTSSFESGDFSGWNAQGEGWAVNDTEASSGKKSAYCAISKGEAPGVKACAKVIPKASPGYVIKGSLDVAGKVKYNCSHVKISIICVDITGKILSEVEKKVNAPSPDFTKVTVPELIVPSGTAHAYIMLIVEVTQPAKSSEWWRFDNIVIQVQ